MKDKIAKVIGELTPINVKFVGKKKITCEIKESELVKRLNKLFKSELDKQKEEIKEKIKNMRKKEQCLLNDLGYHTKDCENCEYNSAISDILKELNK